MTFYYIKHELKLLFRSKKNNYFIVFLLALSLIYSFFILPNQETIETIHEQELKEELSDLETLQSNRQNRGATGYSPLAGETLYAKDDFYIRIHNRMLNAYDQNNFVRFSLLRLQGLQGNKMDFLSRHRHLFEDSPIPGKDTQHLYHQTLLRYQGFVEEDLNVTYPMIEEKTAVQAGKNILLSPVTYLIIFMAIYFSSDILVKNRENKTLLQGLPMNWYKTINAKSFAAFLYSIVTFISIFSISLFAITLQSGFGSLQLHVPIMIGQSNFLLDDYDTISMLQFYLMALSFIPILMLLFIRLNLWFSLLFKNYWVVFATSTLLLFVQFTYFSRSKRELFGFDLSYFPQSYFEFGKVITGDMNFLINVESITYVKGIIVLTITLLIIELMLWLTSKAINKRRFY
ncbi:ABC transporter permease subunit [Alkalibacillus haloalkaliphilus]|uniref:ABC transporter permease subunit n=1 Tax=Alkalibacillus haloalkaliphilus TaxID=94136 RepID=UPI0002E65B59|nr:ABC transporter permease subunit [Alkalibacillus haloalkaliphilus]